MNLKFMEAIKIDEILKALYRNDLDIDFDQEVVDYQRLSKKEDEFETYLEEHLDGECKELYLKLMEMYEETDFQDTQDAFVKGMKIGARLTAAMLCG